MAAISFQGFIEKELTTRDGRRYGYTIAEPHSRKDEQDRWQTVARTFHQVKGRDLPAFSKGDRVTVTGNQKTEVYEKDGEKRYSLSVWADSVNLAGSGNRSVPQQTESAGYGDGWDSAEPF